MKKVIKYYYIKSDHMFAIPEFDHNEYVEVESEEALRKYITSQKDEYGNPFQVSESPNLKFDYTSKAGAIKVVDYEYPKFKKI